MKIQIQDELLPDDIQEINIQFSYDILYNEYSEGSEHVTINTEHLQTLEFEEWLIPWLDIGFILGYDNKKKVYTLEKE